MKKLIGIFTAAAVFSGCSGAKQRPEAAETAAEPEMTQVYTANADSLYGFVEAQLDFGARMPGTDAHRNCGDYIIARLHAFGVDSVAQQIVPVKTFEDKTFNARNIFASINPEAKNRTLLLAHYDTRPWADSDPDPALQSEPVPGANDGASGVAVLLETARVIARELPDSVGVDLLFTDMEDSGTSFGPKSNDSWCLGTQKWVEDMPYDSANKPGFAILLDMVGGADACFHREYFSDQMAPALVSRIWAIARESGFGNRFINESGGAIVDDHIYINDAGIPCVNIIESVNPDTGSFNPTWHTTADNLAAIDRTTMRIVAQTVLNTLAKM